MSEPQIIWQDFHAEGRVPAAGMDMLWASGWRHFGSYFFRYSHSLDAASGLSHIVPLRIPAADFRPSKSQRRVLRCNADLAVHFLPAELRPEIVAMFHEHKQRFTDNVPTEITDFLSPEPAWDPCECKMMYCTLEDQCIAVSFCDIGQDSASSVYGLFDPAFSDRSLGTFTLLMELEWVRASGRAWLYPGYSTRERGVYDYKKSFVPRQEYDWESGTWSYPSEQTAPESAGGQIV